MNLKASRVQKKRLGTDRCGRQWVDKGLVTQDSPGKESGFILSAAGSH